jgi:CRISPR-associated exonuclease Cas4
MSDADTSSIVVPISALEHQSYCPRQCALIHVERVFEENEWTARGHVAHRAVDRLVTPRGGRVIRGLTVWSDRHGLIGRADVVEFDDGGAAYSVEYKSARAGRWGHAEIQLCAQALCLEEMLGLSIEEGAVYHAASRRRDRVPIDADLRRRTVALVEEVRLLLSEGYVPPAVDDRRCPRCSLRNRCLPGIAGRPQMVTWHHRELAAVDRWQPT